MGKRNRAASIFTLQYVATRAAAAPFGLDDGSGQLSGQYDYKQAYSSRKGGDDGDGSDDGIDASAIAADVDGSDASKLLADPATTLKTEAYSQYSRCPGDRFWPKRQPGVAAYARNNCEEVPAPGAARSPANRHRSSILVVACYYPAKSLRIAPRSEPGCQSS